MRRLVRRSAITPPVSVALDDRTGTPIRRACFVAPPRRAFGHASSSRLAPAADCSPSLLRKLGAYFRSTSLAALCVLVALASLSTVALAEDKVDESTCTCKGFKLFGKVKIVEAFPDLKVQVVDAFPDLKVKMVDAFPDSCGKWKSVEAFPDIKIQFVTAFPDIKIKYVEAFPGTP
jgi:hypothetical protein